MTRFCLFLLALLLLLAPESATAKSKAKAIYHGTRSAVARKVARSGRVSMKHARKSARFGKGAYFSTSKAGARREAGKRATLLRARVRSRGARRVIDTRKMSKGQLKRYSGVKDLRGTMKRGVIGPKLGRALGKRAGKDGSGLLYRPKAGKGMHANLVVPARTYRKRLVTTRLGPTPVRRSRSR